MTLPPSLTAERYIELIQLHMPHFHRVACAASEDEFCVAVELAVRHCLQRLEDRRVLLSGAGEVELSTDLADLLTQGGLPTVAEAHINGHVDIAISHFEVGKYRVLGECKIDRGPKYHCEGVNQLLGYCCGAEQRALCIGFCKLPNVRGRMEAARQHFDDVGECHSLEETRDHDLPWSFLGVHRHSSGAAIKVVHMGCNLHQEAECADSD